jgi:hypothetical protein
MSAFVGDGTPGVLRALTGLTRLDVSGSDAVDAAAMEAVGALTGLQVGGCPGRAGGPAGVLLRRPAGAALLPTCAEASSGCGAGASSPVRAGGWAWAELLPPLACHLPPQELGAAGLHPAAMEGLPALQALVQLRRLDLSWNMSLRPGQLVALVAALTALTALDLSWDRWAGPPGRALAAGDAAVLLPGCCCIGPIKGRQRVPSCSARAPRRRCLMAADLSCLGQLRELRQLEVPRLALAERPTLAALCGLPRLQTLDMAMHCFRSGPCPCLSYLAAGGTLA